MATVAGAGAGAASAVVRAALGAAGLVALGAAGLVALGVAGLVAPVALVVPRVDADRLRQRQLHASSTISGTIQRRREGMTSCGPLAMRRVA